MEILLMPHRHDVSDAATLARALEWRRRGEAVAIASALTSGGSTPRPTGGMLAVGASGAIAGSVSAGCVESAVIEAAQRAIKENAPQFLFFGGQKTSDEKGAPWEVGPSCGGDIEVYIRPISDEDAQRFEQLLAWRALRRPVVLATTLEDGRQRLYRFASLDANRAEDDDESDPNDVRAIASILRAESGGAVLRAESPCARLLAQPFPPPLRLLIVGAVHIAQALARMARIAEYDVVVIDPRASLASAERFPDAILETAWPDEALRRLRPDSRTAIAVLSHDPKFDDPALIEALGSSAFYVGALGSRKTQAARRRRLRDAGVGDAALERLHGPIGLAIGARGPAEIAISILADLVATRSRLRG